MRRGTLARLSASLAHQQAEQPLHARAPSVHETDRRALSSSSSPSRGAVPALARATLAAAAPSQKQPKQNDGPGLPLHLARRPRRPQAPGRRRRHALRRRRPPQARADGRGDHRRQDQRRRPVRAKSCRGTGRCGLVAPLGLLCLWPLLFGWLSVLLVQQALRHVVRAHHAHVWPPGRGAGQDLHRPGHPVESFSFVMVGSGFRLVFCRMQEARSLLPPFSRAKKRPLFESKKRRRRRPTARPPDGADSPPPPKTKPNNNKTKKTATPSCTSPPFTSPRATWKAAL